MRRIILGVAAAMVLLVSSPAFAQTMTQWAGTYKLNLAKSTYEPGPGPSQPSVAVFDLVDGVLRIVIDVGNTPGQMNRISTMIKFDGSEQPRVNSSGTSNTMAISKYIDAKTFEFAQKQNGKIGSTVHLELTPIGYTATTTGTDNQGRRIKNVAVFERQ